MRIVDNEEFLAWASYRGLHLDAQYEPPRTLVYPNGTMTLTGIDLPKSVVQWKSALNTAFCLLPKTPLWLYRRGGVWDFLSFSDEEFTSLRDGYNAVLRTIGIPKGEFSIHFSADEHALIFGILALHSLTAVRTRDDIFVVPETAEFCIWVDHDEQLILICKNEDVEQRLRSLAHERGRILPPHFKPDEAR